MKKSAFLAILLAICPAMRAGVMVSTSINLTGFTITPDASLDGSISTDTIYAQVLTGVSALVNAQAADNLGDVPVDTPVSPIAGSKSSVDSATSASSSVSLATANASADGSALTASSSNSISIPSLNAGVISGSLDGNSQLSGSFEIVDSTNSGPNPVNVNFGASLMGNQALSTDDLGISADSYVTFQFSLYAVDTSNTYLGSSPYLFFYNQASIIGPDMTSSTPLDQTVSSTDPGGPGPAALLTNTQYSFFLETDAESDAFDSAAPEPASLMLMAAGLAGLAARRLRRG